MMIDKVKNNLYILYPTEIDRFFGIPWLRNNATKYLQLYYIIQHFVWEIQVNLSYLHYDCMTVKEFNVTLGGLASDLFVDNSRL